MSAGAWCGIWCLGVVDLGTGRSNDRAIGEYGGGGCEEEAD